MHFYKPQRSVQAHFPLLGHLYHESFILMKYKRDFKSTMLPGSINTSELQALILPWFSLICKETKSAKLPLHEGSQACLCQHMPCYQSGILAVNIWNMKTELFSHSTGVFNFSGSSFSFSICQLYEFLLFFYTTIKTEEQLLGKGILPHTLLVFYFLAADIPHQVRSCTSKNLILCPTPQQAQVCISVFVSRYSVEISATTRTVIVAITTCPIHILGSKPTLHLNKTKLFHSGNQRQYLPPALQTQ